MESQRYKDKVTIVTGGSRGIGQGCVEVFHKHGSKVVICSNEEGDGKRLEAELNQKGPGEAYYVYCDVTKEEDIKNLINKTIERYGRIDCLINNAGWHPPFQLIDDISGDEFRKLVDLNMISYFLMAKHALPHLRKTKGNIIQTTSISDITGQAGSVPYAATKGAIASLTKCLAIDEAVNGVRVNAIMNASGKLLYFRHNFAPGNIWTPLWENLSAIASDPEKMIQDGRNAALLGRHGTPEECGLTCLYLAADATFCTGIEINMTGGADISLGVKNPLVKEPGSFF